MKATTLAVAGGIAITLGSVAQGSGRAELRTQAGCVLYDFDGGANSWDSEEAGVTYDWKGACAPGRPISGGGELSMRRLVPDQDDTDGTPFIELDEAFTGEMVSGYWNGSVSFTVRGRNIGPDGQPAGDWKPMTRKDENGRSVEIHIDYTYDMGCLVDRSRPPPDNLANGCVAGVPESADATKTAQPPAPAPEAGAPADGGAEAGPDSEPGGPDHVTESGEGGRETDRFIAARVSRERAPKHHPEHDMSQCLGKYLEEHRPPHNHYVLYNRCDTAINVVWCVMGTGNDCEVGSGSIANMEPRVGYIAGMEDSPGMKAGACSGKVWPIMENGQMAGYGCE